MGGTWSTLVPVALLGALALALVRTTWLRAREPGLAIRQRVGLVLLAAPLLTLLLIGVTSLPTLAGSPSAIPLSPERLLDKTMLHLGLYLATPVAGLVLTLGPRDALSATRDAMLRGRPRRSALRAALVWTAGLSTLLIGAVTLAWGLASAHGGGLLSAGGAEVVFSQVTPGIALLLAGVAALAEEGLFRGMLLEEFDRLTGRPLAIGLQALLFGLIHAGYGSLVHVTAATLFGALMGVLVTYRGLLPAIATHFLVNAAILGLWAGHPSLLAVAGLGLAALVAAAWYLARRPHRSPTGSRPDVAA